LHLLKGIRKQFSAEQVTLRVDANGAFSPEEAPEKLQKLADLAIHSIEQPIAAGQHEAMRMLCAGTSLPVALDEELIPAVSYEERREMLRFIKPQYIILKPSLHGGFSGCLEWIGIAGELAIPWWITSALESNVGLNAIAQFTGTFDPVLPQGLGTGGLYKTNFQSPLFIRNGALHYEAGTDKII
jgi:L-alanine-DL-glutamate epimerase-like enolase superfamily enzyme